MRPAIATRPIWNAKSLVATRAAPVTTISCRAISFQSRSGNRSIGFITKFHILNEGKERDRKRVFEKEIGEGLLIPSRADRLMMDAILKFSRPPPHFCGALFHLISVIISVTHPKTAAVDEPRRHRYDTLALTLNAGVRHDERQRLGAARIRQSDNRPRHRVRKRDRSINHCLPREYVTVTEDSDFFALKVVEAAKGSDGSVKRPIGFRV